MPALLRGSSSILLLATACCLNAGAAALEVGDLRCQYRENPVGVDAEQPRLSWKLTSTARNQSQSAYQIQVATDADKLAAGEADLWDSGKVASSSTRDIPYDGKALSAHQRCVWRVRSWDADGQPGEYSEPAEWTVGILKQDQWQAEWIGYDASRADRRPPADLDGASWIWAADEEGKAAERGDFGFASTLEIPQDAKLESAVATLYGDDQVIVYVNGKRANVGVRRNRPFELDLLHVIEQGENDIRLACHNGSPESAGVIMKLVVKTDQGERTLVTSGDWSSVKSPSNEWRAAQRPADEGDHALVVAANGEGPWGEVGPSAQYLPPPAYLRVGFEITKPVKRALAYMAALGDCDARINGQRVTDDYFPSGWTDYNKRVYYRAYDVTHLLRQGDNAAGVVLADGWFSGHVGWGEQRDHYGDKPRFAGQLVVQYQDGTQQVLATGEAWRAGEGGTREADFLGGEVFDATREPTGWDAPGFDSSGWAEVDRGAAVDPLVQWHPAQPVEAIGEFSPQEITEPLPGVYVLNLGQNFAGVPRLKVKGRKGQAIHLRFGERLNPDGSLYLTNMRCARVTDTYVCSGQGTETWQPRHTFHGFQYVEVRGLDASPESGEVVGVALSSATPRVGSFECSDERVNQLVNNIYWTQRSNFIDIPTDCPQRDERLGWTGDAQVYIGAATLNCDVQAFFHKWLQDMTDSQRADGQYPKVAPEKVAGNDGGPAWADAGVICPLQLYETYGDREILARQYASMKKFVDFCRDRSKDGVLPPDRFHCYGDWLSINASTPNEVIYTAYYAHAADLLSQAAEVLGIENDAREYRELFHKVRNAFNEAYVKDDGSIHGDTQCCYTLAIVFDLVEGDKLNEASRRLVADIESRGGRLSTGFVGTKDLMHALDKIGRLDVACGLLTHEEYPGWLFSIKHGATSIWERWDGWTPDRGFQDPGMNSFAHYSFGAVYRWMVECLGGVKPTSPGYDQFVIAPYLPEDLEWVKVGYDSVHGPIESAWRRTDRGVTVQVTAPVNTTATIRLPSGDRDAISVDGKPLSECGLRVGDSTNDSTAVEIGSGSYEFVIAAES
ncbi:Bacterial alpha-L-rhamnosidase [Posidoniimonas corsicana]|uniref:alpha-L-rhamnosidase n=1 Tax=Posidoniimonas corsicana TaxID=1938618 RepID=A0A5C5VED7_9BACT|nr:family 78 glycoside hydrolase catalytic domain [Posidoniimonas corsicana]TWT36978.1 Bacterial alpha-L-rhamnosidase [Posidoniimonas corsicana]